MAGGKQKDYLADLLADDQPVSTDEAASTEPSPAPTETSGRPARGGGMALLGRESALARVASGDVRQVTQLRLDPARVRIWKGNARIQARLNEENVRDLMDTIIAEGGQKNRARKDVSEIERARNYASALEQHYGGKQRRMAERLKLSEGWLSKMLKVATLPDIVLAAFADLGELTLNPAYKLSQALADERRHKSIVGAAERVTEENGQRAQDGQPPLGGTVVLARLMAAGEADKQRPKLYEGVSRHNRPALSVTTASLQGLTIKVHAASGADEDEMVALFREALASHEYNTEVE